MSGIGASSAALLIAAAGAFAVGVGIVGWAPGHAQEVAVVVDAGPVRRLCEPVSLDVPIEKLPAWVSLQNTDDGGTVPVQTVKLPNKEAARVSWIVHDLPPQNEREYRLRVQAAGAGPVPEGAVRLAEGAGEGGEAGPAGKGVSIAEPADAEGQLQMLVGGQPFTTCRFGPDLARPFCFPVLGVRGQRVTRAFPMEEGVPGETTDHRHHRSFWFAFGSVNGVDCWTEGKESGRTVHRSFEAIEGGPVFGRVRSVNDWVAGDGTKLMEDVRELRVYDVGLPIRMFDFDITLRATEGDVTLGDTKEGMFGFRVASSMDVPRGGKIENSRGGLNEPQTWGRRAEWCDYSGPVGDGTSGITIMDHPTNFRHPTYWMVRGYGLFACNPFGVRAYTRDETQDGTHVIPSGTEMTFRYRMVIHEGEADGADVPLLYAAYASPATARLGDASPGAAQLDDRVPDGYELAFFDDFEDAATAWLPREGNNWQIVELEDGNHVYQLMEKGIQGEIRAPAGISVIRGLTVGDFVLVAKARCLTPASVKGRDINAFFGFQDPTHFYYAHFSNYSNAIHNAICLVNGEPRAPVTAGAPTAARLDDDEFHLIKIVRSIDSGTIEAYIDDMDEPIMTANDTTLARGLVGIGAFDDTAMFDDVRLYVPGK